MFQALGAVAATKYVNVTQSALESHWLLALIQTLRAKLLRPADQLRVGHLCFSQRLFLLVLSHLWPAKSACSG